MCADCSVPLVERLPKESRPKKKPKKIPPKSKYVELLITFNKGEIAVIKSILDAAGIDYHFKGELFQMVHMFPDPARLMVREEQVKEARKLLCHLDFKFSAVPGDEE
jgi:hypothetical protein